MLVRDRNQAKQQGGGAEDTTETERKGDVQFTKCHIPKGNNDADTEGQRAARQEDKHSTPTDLKY